MSDTSLRSRILAELKRVKGPDGESNIVDLGLLSEVVVTDKGKAYFSIAVPPERAEELDPLRQAAEVVVSELEGVESATVTLTAEQQSGANERSAQGAASQSGDGGPGGSASPAAGPARAGGGTLKGIENVQNIVAVASGKGGVGKSTTAVNLALGFAAIGLRTGILDADIYGPSIPRLLGLSGRPEVDSNNILQPMNAYGLKAMSMGFLIAEDEPMIWRGPMVIQALTQMLRDVAWGELDMLLVDMPPGTGDAQLTMAQQVPLAGGIIVSTPQDLALIDARKGLNMFRKTEVPVLGIVENMSYFLCPNCGHRAEIFGYGGARTEAEKLGVPLLGEVPLEMAIRERSDSGQPIVASMPDSPHAQVYRDIADKAWAELGGGAKAQAERPRIVIE
jgi:ATP-binding protein involved in chromosome partitioning